MFTRRDIHLDQPLDRQIAAPDLIVLEGGLNDRSEDSSKVADGYTQLITVMRANWPKAQIVTLGPMAPTSVAVSGVTDIDRALDKAAAALEVPYLDAQQQGWLGDGAAKASYVNTEKGNHPSAAGYAQIATKLVAALKGLTQPEAIAARRGLPLEDVAPAGMLRARALAAANAASTRGA